MTVERSRFHLEHWLQDVRYGVRNLRHRPMGAVVAVTTLALSIGANAAIFAVLNAALFRPLPYPDPDRLIVAYSVNRSQNTAPSIVSPADYLDWRPGPQRRASGGIQPIRSHLVSR